MTRLREFAARIRNGQTQVKESMATDMWQQMQADNAPDIVSDAKLIFDAADRLKKAAPSIDYPRVVEALEDILTGVWSIAYDLSISELERALKPVRAIITKAVQAAKHDHMPHTGGHQDDEGDPHPF